MWRLHGFVGRVLHRYNGSTPLRLPQNHHVEDEVLNSTVLSTSRHTSDCSSQKEEGGERRKKWRTFRFGHPELPRYTALDAVGWGAAAVLFMQLCRRIHSQLSSGTEPSPIPGGLTPPSTLRKCGYRILLQILCKRDVLPGGNSVLCPQGIPQNLKQEGSSDQSSSSSHSSSCAGDTSPLRSSQQNCPTAACSTTDQQRALLSQDSSVPEESFLAESFHLQNDGNQNTAETKDAKDQDALSDEEKLAGAALHLKNVGDISIPVILNIIGLESAKSGNYEEAFLCFVTAAQQGYHKAHFNTGVCYEKGRGVRKDKENALHHYWQAAVRGHREAQYRYAKLLLTKRGQQSLEELNTAISLLEQSAEAGLQKAQLCLASVYSQELVKDGSKSVHYLQMAAERGDDTALLFLGQCFESGFGVQRNLRTAIEYYKRAARAGNKQAMSLLTPPNGTDSKAEDAALRSIRSVPSFPGTNRRLQQPLSALVSHMPHSWSTGSLCVLPGLSFTPLHLHSYSTEGGSCQWTIGVG